MRVYVGMCTANTRTRICSTYVSRAYVVFHQNTAPYLVAHGEMQNIAYIKVKKQRL